MSNQIWVVLLDTSGSMGSGFRRTDEPTGVFQANAWKRKIDAAKDILIARIGALRTPDVALISFSHFSQLLFSAPASEFSRFTSRIEKLGTGGGTDLAQALDEVAMIPSIGEYARIHVLVLSDGLTDPDSASEAAARLLADLPQASIGVTLIDQTEAGDEVAYRVATNEDITYAHSYTALARSIGRSATSMLSERANAIASHRRSIVNEILSLEDRPQLRTISFESTDSVDLTSAMLSTDIVPTLAALETLQGIADSSRKTTTRVRIVEISHASPVSASVSGIAKAIEVLDERLTPWKRTHAKAMADLELRKAQLEVERMELEVMNMRSEVNTRRLDERRDELKTRERRLDERERFLDTELQELVTATVNQLHGRALSTEERDRYLIVATNAIRMYMSARFLAGTAGNSPQSGRE